jgi:hypothetical protein
MVVKNIISLYLESSEEIQDETKSFIYRTKSADINEKKQKFVVILPSFWVWSQLWKLYSNEKLDQYKKNTFNYNNKV